MEEEINEHELLRQCNILNVKHEEIKAQILERTIENEKSIIKLNEIEDQYKIIIEKLRNIHNTVLK